LDVGSPKLPVLLLARNPAVTLHATDLRDYFVGPTSHFLRRSGLGHRLGSTVYLETADARALPYADDSFDLLLSISVVEHIPDCGDSDAMEQFGRVVRPGGKVVLTVPFDSRSYLEEWVQGDVYERKSEGKPVFYQRRYDYASLSRRLVQPSGLTLDQVVYFGEPGFKFERYWNRIPMKLKVPLLWAQPFLARIFLRRLDAEEVRHACGVALVLVKPA
jgi:SAM-dependent methyltransferase